MASTGPVRPGDRIAGKYRVDRVIGRGGMGVVVAATHEQLEQRVALKFLLAEAASNPDVVARFLREARAAVRILSEHVARVLDVGTLESGAPYMVMEYLEGEDLGQRLARGAAMGVEEAVGYVLEAIEAIAEAHALGIVHRDLKPANLFLTERPGGKPIVKVLDFGISKVLSTANDPGMTRANAIMGSPSYMSPEQMTSSNTVDVRSDVWSLGVVLYELLTGRLPFDSRTMPELVAAILQGTPPPVEALRSDVPPGLKAVVDRCLEKDRERRYANVGELARGLMPFAPSRNEQRIERIEHVLGLTSRAPQARADEGAPIARAVTFSPITSSTSPPKRRWLAASALAGAVAVVVASVAMAVRLHRAPPPGAGAFPGASPIQPTPSAAAVRDPPEAAHEPAALAPIPVAPATATSPPAPSERGGLPPTPVAPAPVPPALAPPRPRAEAGRAPAASSSAPSCRIVSYFDTDGNKHFKQVCP